MAYFRSRRPYILMHQGAGLTFFTAICTGDRQLADRVFAEDPRYPCSAARWLMRPFTVAAGMNTANALGRLVVDDVEFGRQHVAHLFDIGELGLYHSPAVAL